MLKSRKQPYSGLHQKKHSQYGKGGDPAPLLLTVEALPGRLYPDAESSAQKKHRMHQRRDTKMILRINHLSCKDRARELLVSSLEKRRLALMSLNEAPENRAGPGWSPQVRPIKALLGYSASCQMHVFIFLSQSCLLVRVSLVEVCCRGMRYCLKNPSRWVVQLLRECEVLYLLGFECFLFGLVFWRSFS